MQLCIFEDLHVDRLFPLTAPRPVYDLRCGAFTLAEKIRHLLPRASVALHVRRYLQDCTREAYPRFSVNELSRDDTWFVNGRVIPNVELARFMKKNAGTEKMLATDTAIVAVCVPAGKLDQFSRELAGEVFDMSRYGAYVRVPFTGVLAEYPWDLVDAAADEIVRDAAYFRKGKRIAGKLSPGVHLVGRNNIFIGKGSVVKPGVVIDAEEGPVIIGSGVTIMPNAVILGPAFIGDHSLIKVGAKIYHGTSIGAWCKVGGEVESSLLQSYANKQHDGFLGHSYVGSWVNLGADTNTSDLKNTYGNVQVRVQGRTVDTGRTFVGLTMGDHSKSGINAMFDTGTIVGVSCNVYGAGLPPKYVPSFSWGEAGNFREYELEKSIAIARKVMERRKVTMSAAYERMMRELYSMTAGERAAEGVRDGR